MNIETRCCICLVFDAGWPCAHLYGDNTPVTRVVSAASQEWPASRTTVLAVERGEPGSTDVESRDSSCKHSVSFDDRKLRPAFASRPMAANKTLRAPEQPCIFLESMQSSVQVRSGINVLRLTQQDLVDDFRVGHGGRVNVTWRHVAPVFDYYCLRNSCGEVNRQTMSSSINICLESHNGRLCTGNYKA